MLPGPEHYRRHHEPKDMSTDDVVACFELAVRLRSFEPDASLDHSLEMYLSRARRELEERGELERVRG
jgi:hypothetical protein